MIWALGLAIGLCIIFALFLVRGACTGRDTCFDPCLVRRKPYTLLGIS